MPPPKEISRKYKKKRIWTAKEERLLVDLWREYIKDLKNSRKNRHLYDEIGAVLQQQGCVAETDEIKTKIHNLTTRYRREKFILQTKGTTPEWHLFKPLDKLLGDFEISKVEQLMSEIEMEFNDASSGQSEDSNQGEYANENDYDHDSEQEHELNENDNDETEAYGDGEQELVASHHTDTKYLKNMNSNLEIFAERFSELSERIVTMEENTNVMLEKLFNVLNDSSIANPAKRAKLMEQESEISLLRNKRLLEEHLETKRMERQCMSERHALQMEILKLELAAKKKELASK